MSKHYEHCESSANKTPGIRRFRFVWDYRKHKPNAWSGCSYQAWRDYCVKLKTFFDQYPDVVWHCISFEFIVSCDNLLWVAEQVMRGPGGAFLNDVNEMQHWVDGKGHVALNLEQLLGIT
jgi:hypothetical protein